SPSTTSSSALRSSSASGRSTGRSSGTADEGLMHGLKTRATDGANSGTGFLTRAGDATKARMPDQREESTQSRARLPWESPDDGADVAVETEPPQPAESPAPVGPVAAYES